MVVSYEFYCCFEDGLFKILNVVCFCNYVYFGWRMLIFRFGSKVWLGRLFKCYCFGSLISGVIEIVW